MHNNEMSSDEIYRILRIIRDFGIRKVKFTGGEPLVREDVVEIVHHAKSLMYSDISLTTNGTLLTQYAKNLKEAGLNRVNISLDTLVEKKYEKITGQKNMQNVIDGIKESVKFFNPVKLNYVLLKGINDNELEDMIRFSADTGAILQIIELEAPVEKEQTEFFKKYHISPKFIEENLQKISDQVKFNELHRRRRYLFDFSGRRAEVEIVRPMHNTEFCMNCTRIRITSDGKIKPCLLRNDNLVDILSPMRNGAEDGELREAFKKAILLREPYWKPNKLKK